jgi:hypothetical protein
MSMSFEEGMESLRHEVSVLTADMKTLVEMHRTDHERLEELQELRRADHELLSQVVALQGRMARILESHDERLDRLEGN